MPGAESPETTRARQQCSRKRREPIAGNGRCGLSRPSTSGTLVATGIRNRGYEVASPIEGPRSNPPVFGAIFAIESDPPARLLRVLQDAQRGLDPELWVDCICILDQAVMYRPGGRGGPAGWTSEFPGQPPPTRIALAGPDALLFFYLTLLQDINTKTLLPPDLEFYW
ncbi:MAG: hypothetical protein FJ291_19860 [Planctomycetes bacterium]|nr:hypothetical protein [Planctomycetota bacterium]